MPGYIKNTAMKNGFPFSHEEYLIANQPALFSYTDANSLVDSLIIENMLFDSIIVVVKVTTISGTGLADVDTIVKSNIRVPGRDAVELLSIPLYLPKHEVLIVDLVSRGDAGWVTPLPTTIGLARVYGTRGI